MQMERRVGAAFVVSAFVTGNLSFQPSVFHLDAVDFLAKLDYLRADEAQRDELEPPDDEADDALLVRRALEGDLAGVQRCLDALAQEEPPEVFADFKASLLQAAKARPVTSKTM
jgi:hypothetical protein